MDSEQKKHVEDITYLCKSVMKSMKLMMREQLKNYDLSVGEFEVLMFLSHGPYDTSKDMARQRGYSRSVISKMVDRLLKQDYLATEQDREDRRVIHLKLTQKAETILGKAKEIGEKIDEILCMSITPQEMEIVINALKRVKACLDEQQI